MKSLCITGASSTSCQFVATKLYKAGLQPAQPLKHGVCADMSSWHKRAIPLLRAGRPLGRLWEKTAEEMIFASPRDSAWGWHDAQSLWALDFWAELEEGICFLLLCESPETAVARALLGTNPEPDIEAVLEQWRAKQSELLRFYLDYPERSLLVDAQQAVKNLPQLIASCNEKWPKFCFNSDSSSLEKIFQEGKSSSVDDFARQLGSLWCWGLAPWVDSLWQEIVAEKLSLVNTTSFEESVEPDAVILSSTLKHYKNLMEVEGKYLDLENTLSESRRENESLEEKLSIALSDNKEIVSNEKIQAKKLLAANRELSVLHQEQGNLQQVLENTQHQASDLKQRQSNMETECESLLLSLHNTQEALESSLAQRQASQHAFETGQAEIAATLVVNQQMEQEKQLVEKEVARLASENETTLLTWQACQQQLEETLQAYQQQQGRIQEYRQRLHALKRRAGLAYAAEDLKLIQPDAQRLEWYFEKLLLEEIEHDALEVTANLSWDSITVDVSLADGEQWSLDTSRPTSLNAQLPHQQKISINLIKVMKETLSVWQDGTPENVEEWQRSLNALQAVLEQVKKQPSLCYEGIELRHVQANPDYEHLWITLHQAQFAATPPQDWHFRISCANVTPESFGRHPKLEIPYQNAQLLQGWFEESKDDLGSKLELRFALPEDMDVGIWMCLPYQDQLLLRALFCQLPEILSSIEKQGYHIGRGWQDWYRLAADMRHILQAKAV